MDFKIDSIFPTPLYLGKTYGLTLEEETYMNQCKTRNALSNGGTEVSEEDYVLSYMPNLTTQIKEHLSNYVDNILCPENKVEIEITQSWINKSNINSYRDPHIHTNSFISGVIYLTDSLTPIVFHKPTKHLNWFDIESTKINAYNTHVYNQGVFKNMLLLFPSNLAHSVVMNTSNDPRISIAFNTFIKGNLGSRNRMTFLELK
jgi:uncharacterized protein (TIGR02466 family)